jgi:hypothetical protein
MSVIRILRFEVNTDFEGKLLSFLRYFNKPASMCLSAVLLLLPTLVGLVVGF